MSLGKKIAKNLFSLSVAELINKILAFVIFAYLARVLGSGAFGKLSFAQAIMAYVVLMVNLGLNTIGTREVAKHPDKLSYYFNHIYSIRIFSSIFSFGLLYLFLLLINKDPETERLTLYFGMNVFFFAITLDWLFQGIEKMHFIALVNIIKQILYAGLVLIYVQSPEHLMKVGIFFTSSNGVAMLVGFVVVVGWYGFPKIKIQWEEWKAILRESIPIGFSMVMITLYYNLDTIMLSFMKTDEVVGWYNAAYKIVLTLGMPATIYFNGFFPSLSRTSEPETLKKATHNYIRGMFLMGVPIGFGGFILAPHVISLVFGSEYNPSVLPLQILVWNCSMIYINMSFGMPLLAWGKQIQYTKIVSMGALSNLIFNFALIPTWGMTGAAVATILGELTVFFGVYLEFQKSVRASFFSYVKAPFVASLSMSLVLWLSLSFISNVLILFLLGIFIYALTLVLLGEFKVESFKFLRSSSQKGK